MSDKRFFYINGEWTPPAQNADAAVINPSTEEECAVISLAAAADVDKAMAAARDAFLPWAQTPPMERAALLKTLLGEYQKRADEMAQIISMEMGAPLTLAQNAQAAAGESHIQNAINALEKYAFETPLTDGNMLIREPVGVCALITPWNWPMNQIALKVAPALAAGCTMVLKPSEIAPLSAMLFADIVHSAGFPPGVFNLLNGDGAGAGSLLSAHTDADMVSFTGSARAGALVSKNAADTVKRVSLELGGKGANIIFNDADEQAAIRGARHCFNNTGQSCNAPSRMFVERAAYDKAVAQCAEVAKQTAVDNAAKEGRHIGPAASAAQFDKIRALIQSGIDQGAKLIAGGIDRPNGLQRGYFVRPTVFADVRPDMDIARQEIFGPVLAIAPFDSEAEAVAAANDTIYGLTNYVQTTDQTRARRIARQLRSGMVEINGERLCAGAPFGGYKQSGNGREGGVFGMEEFLEVKVVSGWQSK